MTRDEVIELATKAGGSHFAKYSADVFVRFAEAVAAHESEVCAKICDRWSRSLSSIPAREIRARAIKETP